MAHVSRNERGVALVITLLVITLLSIIVTEFTYSTEVSSHLTRNTLNATQAHYLARSGVHLGELALLQDVEEESLPEAPQPPADTLHDSWAAPFPPMRVGGGHGEASFAIVDERSRFNLNALAETNNMRLERNKELFQAILSFLGLDTNLLFPLLDWIDPDDERQSEHGAESRYYLGLRPPYVPRNGLLLTIDELALIKGFESLTASEWANLRELVTVLPDESLEINVNTASEMLLTALLSGSGSPELGAALVRARETQPFRSRRELNEVAGMNQIRPAVRQVLGNTRSSFYTIYGTGRAAGLERTLAVTVERPQRAQADLRTLRWAEHTGQVPLTSREASDQMSRDSL